MLCDTAVTLLAGIKDEPQHLATVGTLAPFDAAIATLLQLLEQLAGFLGGSSLPCAQGLTHGTLAALPADPVDHLEKMVILWRLPQAGVDEPQVRLVVVDEPRRPLDAHSFDVLLVLVCLNQPEVVQDQRDPGEVGLELAPRPDERGGQVRTAQLGGMTIPPGDPPFFSRR